MTQVIVDPDEMRRFERALRELGGEIAARRNAMDRQIKEVHSFWNDEKYRAFQNSQEQLALEIQVFEKVVDRYCGYLRRKAAAADAYLGR